MEVQFLRGTSAAAMIVDLRLRPSGGGGSVTKEIHHGMRPRFGLWPQICAHHQLPYLRS